MRETVKRLAMACLLAVVLAAGLYMGEKAAGHDAFGHDWREALMYARLIVRRQSDCSLFHIGARALVLRRGNTWTVRGCIPPPGGVGTALCRRYEVTLTFTAENRYRVEAFAAARCR